MSTMNLDILTRLTGNEPAYADGLLGTAAGSQSEFSAYLQRAQTQSAGTSPPSDGWNGAESSDSRGPQTPASASAISQADAGRATDRTLSHSANHRDDSSARRQDVAPAGSSQADPSSSTAANGDSTATSQSGNDNGQNSNGRSSNQDSPQSTDATRQDDEHKIKPGDRAAVIVDISTAAAAAANSVTAAAGNTSGVQGQAAATTGAQPGNAPSAGRAPAPSVDGALARSTDVATANANGQAEVAQTLATRAELIAPAVNDGRAAVMDAGTIDPSTATAKPNEAAAAGSIASPPANSTATPPGDPKPRQPSASQSAAVGVVGAAPANQIPDAPAGPNASTDDDAPLVPDVQSSREQRASSAVQSLSQSDSGNTTTTAVQSGNSISGPAAASPQAAIHNASATGGGAGTAQTTDTTLSQADRVRFVQRVEQVFQDLDGQGGSVRLRLSPPELGSLHIEINVAKGEMTARVQAETPAARNILLDNLPALRERLAQHDIKVQSFDVDLMDRSKGGMSNQSSQYQNPSQQNADGPVARPPLRGGSELPANAPAAPSRPVGDGGRLNVVV